jgi:hypothetical protein
MASTAAKVSKMKSIKNKDIEGVTGNALNADY